MGIAFWMRFDSSLSLIGWWCNGSIAVSKTVDLGSNPSRPANLCGWSSNGKTKDCGSLNAGSTPVLPPIYASVWLVGETSRL